MILCDVGNSRMHFLEKGAVSHLGFDEGLSRYGDRRVYFICVNDRMRERITDEAPGWIELDGAGLLKSDYSGLVVEKGAHKGGWIWPGVASFAEAYAGISPRLALDMDQNVDLSKLPCDTRSAVSFAVLAPVKLLVESFSKLPCDTRSAVSFAVLAPVKLLVESYAARLPVTITGGDAHIFAPLFPEARVDEMLVFRGMEKMIKEN